MRLPRSAPLGLLLLLAGGAAAQEQAEGPEVDHVVVRKAQRVIQLYSLGRLVHEIPAIQLGGDPVGHKRFQGDKRTPEGRYTISYGNPESSYYLSLHISYPNAADVSYARAFGRSPGGQIFIHGQPNGWTGERVPGDWTDGCIAVSNEEMDLLWEAVPDGAVIDILP